MKVHYVVEELLGTDGEYSAEVYHTRTAQEAGEFACGLIASMASQMGVEGINPEKDWEIDGNEWWYRVRIGEDEIGED